MGFDVVHRCAPPPAGEEGAVWICPACEQHWRVLSGAEWQPYEEMAEVAPAREVARTGWHFDMLKDAWVNGRHAIGHEIFARFPLEQINRHAIELTGEPLPETVTYEFADRPVPWGRVEQVDTDPDTGEQIAQIRIL